MKYILLSQDNFAYDIHSLVKAFYPSEEVLISNDIDKLRESGCKEPDYFIELNNDNFQIKHGIESDKSGINASGLDINNRPEYKNELKRALYNILSGATGISLPWGVLTGIRPTKIAKSILDNGLSKTDVIDKMTSAYYCSRAKSSLAADIAEYENEILSRIDYEKGYSLYIGIPFCPSTCLYCSFTSYAIGAYRKWVPDYIAALKKEIDYVSEHFKDRILNTVYIGGGTPTTLEADELRDLIDYLKSSLDFSNVLEFTVEAGRADSITEEKLRCLYEAGVTRISVNPQTMNEDTLKIIGRKATAAATVEAYKIARDIGFDNINMDLIIGLPGEDIEDVRYTLEKVRELKPDSLTVHSLAIKRASRLSQVIDEMGYDMIRNSDEIMELTNRVATDMDMKAYYLYRQKNMTGNFENVGYALRNKAGIYNILIMEEVQDIVALGAGTVSKRLFPGGRLERCDTVKDVNLYIDKIDEMIERKHKLYSVQS